MEILVIAVLIGLIPATVAKNKGYSFGAWWFYGAALFILALPHALMLKPNQTGIAREQEQAGMRRCDRCAEFIQQAAKVCRFCSSEQTDYAPPAPPMSEYTGRPLNAAGW